MEYFKLDPDEKEIAKFRKHWWVIASEMGFLFLFAAAPIFILFSFNFTFSPKLILFLIMLYIAWIFLLWITGFIIWTNYYLDVWILTNKRLIDIDQKSLFSRDIATLRLENIQDVKIEIMGIINSILKIGNIHIQTAAQSKEFLMRNIKNPEIAKEFINQAHQQKIEEVKTVKVE